MASSAYLDAQDYFRFLTMYNRTREETWRVFLGRIAQTGPPPVAKAARTQMAIFQAREQMKEQNRDTS